MSQHNCSDEAAQVGQPGDRPEAKGMAGWSSGVTLSRDVEDGSTPQTVQLTTAAPEPTQEKNKAEKASLPPAPGMQAQPACQPQVGGE
jgi:hypothetical protein